MPKPSELALLLRLQREIMLLPLKLQRALFDGAMGREPDGDQARRKQVAQQRPVRRRRKAPRRAPLPKKAQVKAIRPARAGSVPDRAIRVVLASEAPLTAAAVLHTLRKETPKLPGVNVYTALHTAAGKRVIVKKMRGNKAVYSRPEGGR
jgi:hypothetical protein